MAPKRKAPSRGTSDQPPTKKRTSPAIATAIPVTKPTASKVKAEPTGDIKPEPLEHSPSPSRPEERYGIVQRAFYPPEMSLERCNKYRNNELPRPIELLQSRIQSTAAARNKIPVGEAVVHWFKRDLRTHDNRSLSIAAERAHSAGVPLICLFVVSPQDYEAHLTSAVRVDFELRGLEVLRNDLAEKDIPLVVETVEKRRDVPGKIVEWCVGWGAKHVFCNIEYEVDELRREEKLTAMCLEQGISFTAVHDDAVVPPGAIATQAGKQFSVYSPWFRAWVAFIHKNPHVVDESPPPGQNQPSARKTFAHLFDHPIPSAPPNKTLSPSDKSRFLHLWPAGEHAALSRLDKFLAEKASSYKTTRDFPALSSTAVLSPHLSTGTLSARTALRAARRANTTTSPLLLLDAGADGPRTWIAELAWRDFYKHVLAHWPHVCMHIPFKPEYLAIRWRYDDADFAAWRAGRTGYPLVDAAMRQLASTGWMHNRLRMVTASFLAKHLLLDWRLGERFFMLSLVDADFASNNGGWGFSASCGVDPQPYFRIFNPLLQSEKFDPDGAFIRKWVPELRNVLGKAVHEPYGRGAGAVVEKEGYPRPIVEHAFARKRCLERYKEGLGRDTA